MTGELMDMITGYQYSLPYKIYKVRL